MFKPCLHPTWLMYHRRATAPAELALDKVVVFRQTSILGPRLTQFQIRAIHARERVITARNCEPEIREYVVMGTRRKLNCRNVGRRCWTSNVCCLQYPSISRRKLFVRRIDYQSQSVLRNRDTSSAGDPTDMSFVLSIDSSAAYEIIRNKDYNDISLSGPLYRVRSAIVEMFQHLVSSIRL